ncbi:MAG: hypothetical protein K5880_18695 [Hydrogenophaga sp.]|jgi:hypothetical protein|uniref:hypothetical protein n=1 Tax=Hydrogenophaga sp. TaxID=1904254 RepID=UPI0026121B1F|nr:hypothetical protein [Hydrogenophaga sp.]MCV0440627.1 hypothetical protein [Hydrogenophaga sp.]
MLKRFLLCMALLMAATAHAKLPAPPPPTEEAKAKAAEAAARTAWSGKVAAYKLCKAQDKAAASYFKSASMTGKSVKPADAAPACTDPGPFAYVTPKPAEAAGAHSPAATAVSPPSSQAPAGAATPAKK